MKIQESAEMYLESIFLLKQKQPNVRSVDISLYTGYSKPSVSRAMGILRTGDYIIVDKDGAITLTDAGRAVAEKIYERHTVLTGMLIKLGVDEVTAAEDACKMEHDISDQTLSAIKKFISE